ncbi:MAG: hypothetical protein OXH34_08625 [Bacteroidetes bacterium]|nr:hypothetical protein [Bacteroidota bacterium]
MKKLLSLTAVCMFLFFGSILPAQAQTISCFTHEAITYVTYDEDTDSWDMVVFDRSTKKIHRFKGEGRWTGSICNRKLE